MRRRSIPIENIANLLHMNLRRREPPLDNLHHHLEFLRVDYAVLVLIAALDDIEEMIDESRFDCCAIAEGVDFSEGGADDAEVGIDFESVFVVLIWEERGDFDRKWIHSCVGW